MTTPTCDEYWVSDLVEKIEGLIEAHIAYNRADHCESKEYAYERIYHYRDLVIEQLEGVLTK